MFEQVNNMKKFKKAAIVLASILALFLILAFALLVFTVQNPLYHELSKEIVPGKSLAGASPAWSLHNGIDSIVFGLASNQAQRFFRDGVQSESIENHLQAIQFSLPRIEKGGFYPLEVRTADGSMQAGVMVLKWMGSSSPTFIYNHGASQIPFDALIRGIIQSGPHNPRANILVVRTPFHTESRAELGEASNTVSRFLAILATSTRINESLIQQMRKSGSEFIVVAGLSMGGYIANLHRMYFNTSDLYLPVAAGTNFADAFLHGSPAHPAATAQPDAIRKHLDFSGSWKDTPRNVIPLLGRYDGITRIEIQGPGYGAIPVEVWDTGHITTATSVQALNEFLFRHFEEDSKD
ncbi:MAG: hypothetical protein CMF59_02720 [Leptospiraceae bacterium]|nr:hypothetical protein [Leptospiraceae bacterium]